MGQAGMNSNVGGAVNQAIVGAGEGPRPPGLGPGAAAAAAAGIPPPPRTFPFGLPRGAPTPPTGGAPFSTTAHVPLPQQATAAGAPTPRQGGGPRGFAATTAAANAGARGVHFGETDQFGLPIPPTPLMQTQARPPPPPPPQAHSGGS